MTGVLPETDLGALDGDPALFSGAAEEIARREDFVKMLVQSSTRSPDELLADVLAVVGDTLTVTHSAARDLGLVEVSGPRSG